MKRPKGYKKLIVLFKAEYRLSQCNKTESFVLVPNIKYTIFMDDSSDACLEFQNKKEEKILPFAFEELNY